MTKAKELPSVEILNDFLRYDKESGILYWKHRPRKYFDSDRKYSYWNKRFQNKQANHIHFKKEKNYLTYRLRIFDKIYMAHRIIYKIIYGEEPETIDHINGNSLDNKIENLRSVTQLDNTRNMRKTKYGDSGVYGVHTNPKSKKNPYRSSMMENNKRVYKYFSSKDEAFEWKKQMNIKNGYHENHGRERNAQ